ncbi:hypothetical protein GCM10025858_40580 [Alicyclobacillus sacchari]|uniref:hypothetical protein n=1 Tax=Alicyclobacillus TaxID=29330 RepID=UPI000281B538|nr:MULTISPECIES: hypothetical protein [Alicyclobacillus]EJY57264.1 hypothetical protein URH17368_0054 [Alicyclobacillus hesperidum URH17-3-68]GMA59465.1 hypothetical protein GCM10025858_39690 [Alicyclobacillus sacchari]GMA59554.1 hypothetical protein GCM10025858_40580 [Alicyclobacillus sacchari]
MRKMPAFFASDDDEFVLRQILKHYLDGTLPNVLTAHRGDIEQWEREAHEKHVRL